jgi:hypothetical protein
MARLGKWNTSLHALEGFAGSTLSSVGMFNQALSTLVSLHYN